jgi:hypothetical protein
MPELPDILREYFVKIIPAAKAGPQPEYPDDLGLRTKFGGLPHGVQSGDEIKARCPKCTKRMHFVGQIDSFEFNGKNNPHRKEYREAHFMFSDVGIIYVWFCFKCLKPLATMESY